jgi:acyl-CoA thioesterase-2
MISDRTPRELVDELTALLQVQPADENAFDSVPTPTKARTGAGRVFGGQVIAQALMAASATVPDNRAPHSLHAYFLRMGDDDTPVRYDVARDLDGGSFSNRRVAASQHGKPILSLNASFHRRENGLSHQDEMPDVPPPEALVDDIEKRKPRLHLYPEERRAMMGARRPIEQRAVEDLDWINPTPSSPLMHIWFRASAPLADSLALHRAVFAYASDLFMLRTTTLPHGIHWFDGEMLEASLDHAVWFHEDFRVDEWLLFQTRSSWAGRGRGYATGKIFTRDGRLVASATQEGMIRLLKKR